ncbi:DMT family transporter [Brevibacterium litoralis]|uniref:DMT family transporter n=1 Tax=Brevibacterium litoralis TaxID=3138935 RepID=UPI0032EECF2A
MPWLVLVISGVLEAVWATALGASETFTRPGPTLVFALGLVASMVGLGWAMRSIPVGTAYAVWTGIGAALTVLWAVATGTESLSPLKALFLAGIVGAVIGLKLVPSAVGGTADGPGPVDGTADPAEVDPAGIDTADPSSPAALRGRLGP